MDLVITAEQAMLRDSVRRFLLDRAPVRTAHLARSAEAGWDPGLWREMAELGWVGVQLPEEHGGAGFSFTELGLVVEELGRSLTPSPMLGTVVLGAGLLMLAGSPSQRAEHLPAVVAGERTLAVAVVDEGGSWDVGEVTATARRAGDGYVLDGVKSYVIDGHSADVVLVAANVSPDAGIGFFVVPGDAEGMVRSRLETMDTTRPLGRVELREVQVASGDRLPGVDADTVARLYELAVTALAFEQVGGAQACLEMSVAYAKERRQFGRPIGSFQAVKHTCAAMLVAVESARSTAYHAGRAMSHHQGQVDEPAIAAALAKSCCSDAFLQVAADTIQVHGGIGFTWEHDAHLYLKRAKTSQLMFGDPAAWRRRLARHLAL